MGTDVTGRETRPTAPASRWRPLLLGLAAIAVAPVVSVLLRAATALLGGRGASWPVSPASLSVAASVAVGFAGLVSGLRALAHHERSWPVWAGTVLSGLVALTWTSFALAEVMFPH